MGQKLDAENYGSINIPHAHKHLSVGVDESETWLLCMKKAINNQPYKESFKIYLIVQLIVPAERVRRVQANHSSSTLSVGVNTLIRCSLHFIVFISWVKLLASGQYCTRCKHL